MPKWQPRTPKQSLQVSLDRLKQRIVSKQQEIKELEAQARQIDLAIKALG